MLLLAWCLALLTCCSGYHMSWGPIYNSFDHTYDSDEDMAPQDVMVDYINRLGLYLLNVHNEDNLHNNIAVSPYGAVSVLIALAEGLRGDSALEIYRATHIPHDLTVIRIGLRDIHRHLKSYFIPKEGFLAGLTLSHENVTLNPSYEKILQFYGYDVESFNRAQTPDLPPITDSTFNMLTTTPATMGVTEVGVPNARTNPPIATTQVAITEVAGPEETTPSVNREETTAASPDMPPRITEGPITIPVVEVTMPLDTMQPSTVTEVITSSVGTTARLMMSEETTVVIQPSTDITKQTDQQVTTTVTKMSTSTTKAPPTSSTEFTAGSSEVTTNAVEIKTTYIPLAVPETQPTIAEEVTITTKPSGETTLPTTLEQKTENRPPEGTTSTTAMYSSPETVAEGSETTYQDSPTTPVETTNRDSPTTPVAATTEPESELLTSTAFVEETTPSRIVSGKRETEMHASQQKVNVSSRIGMLTAINIQSRTKYLAPEVEKQAVDETNKRNQRSIIDYIIARYYDDYYIPKKHHYPKFHNRIPFFVDGFRREDRTHFMTYDTVLPFFYIESLEALALSFPLDSANYYLLLILPVREHGIDDLICDLKRTPDLKFIIRNMKYTHVKAIIPSFTLNGHVNLTPSLQKLGIQKIFEPGHADFSPMTNSNDIYVTNIEQAITVTIRNYVDLGAKAEHGDLHQYGPVEFKADHPFVYFVMDSQMHVALMAGKIMNPMISKIK